MVPVKRSAFSVDGHGPVEYRRIMAKFTKLMIDDSRVLQAFAQADGWDVIKRGEDLPSWIDSHGWPEAIAMDYDLQHGHGTWDGGRVALWLKNAFDQTGRPAAAFPLWDAHSSLAAGNLEIEETLSEFASNRRSGLAPIKRA